jgi:uncharacterized protein (UPF0332 family)
MKMPYADLQREKRIQPYRATPTEIRSLLSIAERDLGTAARNLAEDPDWAYNIAYNAILQSARALMMSAGFRPRGAEHHATVVKFTEEYLGKEFFPQVAVFDRMRRTRNRSVYEMDGMISKQEAQDAVTFARSFVDLIRERTTGQMSLSMGDKPER